MTAETRSEQAADGAESVLDIEGVGCVHAWGDPGKPLVILLHGFMQTGSSWRHVAPLLEHHRVLAPDLLGHGKTAFEKGDRLRLDEYLVQVKNLIRWATNSLLPGKIEQVRLVGYSLGGRIAALYAATYPEDISALVLESAGLGPRDEEERELRVQKTQKMIDKLDRSVALDPVEPLAGFVEYWESLPLFASQAELSSKLRKSVREERLTNDPFALRQTLEDAGQHHMSDLRPALANLDKPILYLVGERDVAYTEIARSLMRAWAEEHLDPSPLNRGFVQVSVIPQVGHNTHLEAPDEYAYLVDKFLMCNA